MVLHEEFDAATKEREYAVAVIDDQETLHYYAEMNGEAAEGERKCGCAEHQGPHHLIFDRMVEFKKDCREHVGAEEPDSDCPTGWSVLGGELASLSVKT
jgi:hypothetical protein